MKRKRFSYTFMLTCSIFTSLAQNVGIGTNTPLRKLSVQTPTASYGIMHTDGTIRLSTFIGGSTNGGWLGTETNHPLSFFTNNSSAHLTIATNGNIGISNSTPSSPLSFPNVTGPKISLWNAGPNNDFGIGLNLGVMQFYTAGTDKIAFGWGNTNAFNETIAIHTGSGMIAYPNVLGNKISFWRAGPNNDYGIGINTGVMQIYTAGTDKIAFGWGNANAFNETMTFYTGSGQLGIGTTNLGSYRLTVNGNIRSKEIIVETGWADYVFEPSYTLMPIENLEEFIREKKHLPNIPAAKEIMENGLPLGDMQTKMMAKIEELTLYVIQLKKQIEQIQNKNQ